jgi:hypothetical protein
MKPAISAAVVITGAAAMAGSALGQSAALSSHLHRTQTAFDLTVRLPYAQAAPLFGPEGERPWAGKHWDPQFLYPQPGHDEQGAVFTVNHGTVTATWVNTLFDIESHHFIYAYFIPGIMVTIIDVRFTVIDPPGTGVHVVYTRTALTPEGNHHVDALTENDKSAAQDWQAEIDNYLATRKP